MSDVKLALRRLATHRAATLASIVTLACSIGAAAATWSLLSAVLLHPLPVQNPERLIVLGLRATQGRDAGVLQTGVTYPYYPYLRDAGVAGRVAAYWTHATELFVSRDGVREGRDVLFVSHDFLDVLGIRMSLGRSFGSEDDQRGSRLVGLISDRWWRAGFGSRPDVLGRTILVSGKAVTIVGVLPPGFRGVSLADTPDVFMPLQSIRHVASERTNYFAEPSHGSSPTAGVGLVARIPDGDTVQAVGRRLAALPMPLPRRAGAAGAPPQFGAISLDDHAIPRAARPGMVQFTRLLGITVGLLLLVGCVTVGMLLLVRTEARREEFAVCLALGASRSRLAAGVAFEGVVLAASGAAAAVPVAAALFRGARTFQLPGGVQVEHLDLGIDLPALGAIVCAALATCVIIAAIAAALGFRTGLADALRAKSSTPRLARRRARALLVSGQVAVALTLVAGAGLFARSLAAALRLNPAHDPARLVSTAVSLAPHGYDAVRASAYFDDLAARVQGNPALRSFAFSVWLGGMSPGGHIVIDGSPRQFPSLVHYIAVDDRYFRTVGLLTSAGRDFTAEDGPAAPRVTIVSESFGRRLADGGDPLGRRITLSHSRAGQAPEVMEVVGVVPDVITNVAVDQPLVMYFPLAQHAGGTERTLTFRAAGDVDAARAEVSAVIQGLDRAVIPSTMLTMRERLGAQMGPQRMGAFVLGSLAAIALLLTLLGTFVLAETMATLRMREMGIRAALGATRGELARTVLLETLRLVGFGVAAGLLLAWLGAGTIRSFLFRIQPLDPLTLAGTATALVLLACAVSLRPALRAARVDLSTVLKVE